MRAAIYARVSTADQNPEHQLREVQDYATRQGWQVVASTMALPAVRLIADPA
jgi:DNA invertase Pin-like site-specific DNA recombinase